MAKVQEEKYEELKCVRVTKVDDESENLDTTIYKAVFQKGEKKESNMIKVTVESSSPLKALVGEDVTFKKLQAQQTLGDAISKEKEEKEEAKKKK